MSDALVIRHAEDVMRVASGHGRAGVNALDETIGGSWARCVNTHRLDPSRMTPPTVHDLNDLKDRQAQHDELIAIAAAEMDSLYDQISGSGYALLLSDDAGVILREKLDPTLRSQFRAAGLIQGANWSEQNEGTNGVGTCLSEGRSVTVHRSEHFRSRHIGLSCSGAPIRNPAGKLVAVLDASTVSSHDTRLMQMHTMALVNLSATMIEKCLFLRSNQNRLIVRFHLRPELVNLVHDAALALDETGVVSAVDSTAVRLLGATGRHELVGRSMEAIFDCKLDELVSGTRTSRNAIWPVRDLRRHRRMYVGLNAPSQAMTRHADPPTVPAGRNLGTTQAAVPQNALTLEQIAGDDPKMLRNVRCARRIAGSDVAVLIQGATGSGKEAFAKALHLASPRADKPFVAVNCAAIPETLIESELFGYKAGAFTGARKEGMKGKVLQSSGGTLFLDEIGDMPLSLQTRLLRVLEEHEIVPLGAEAPVKVDLRVLCASHRNLREMIDRGEFREDLYYRLNGITLELPALSERTDKEALVRHFIAAETRNLGPAAIETEVLECLLSYPWPGNIRELRNVIRTALAICDGGIVRIEDLPRELREHQSPARCFDPSDASASTDGDNANPLEVAERQALLDSIERNRMNMSATAQMLGMSRNTLYRKLKYHGINVAEARREHR